MSPSATIRILFVSFSLLVAGMARAEFLIRDGDKVAFLGDSITAARGYPKIVEHYTLMRFPTRKVEFVNAGQGGDTAEASLQRLARDVFSKKPSVVIVAFGINDIAWGTQADDAHKRKYLDGIKAIIGECGQRGIRTVICSAAITAEDSFTAEKGYLQAMGDEGIALAKSLGAETIDLQRGMREIQQRVEKSNASVADPAKRDHLHVADGIHLTSLGELAMAYVILKGLGAPVEVSSVTVDAEKSAAVTSADCTISGIERLDDGIAFTRLDEGLPLTLGAFTGLNYRWIPIPEGINGYTLTVRNLPKGTYSLHAGGRDLGQTTSEKLAAGLNIASMTADNWQPGGPWDAQSNVVKSLVEARDQLWMSGKLQDELLPGRPGADALQELVRKQDQELLDLQRTAARPFPYRFEIRRVGK